MFGRVQQQELNITIVDVQSYMSPELLLKENVSYGQRGWSLKSVEGMNTIQVLMNDWKKPLKGQRGAQIHEPTKVDVEEPMEAVMEEFTV